MKKPNAKPFLKWAGGKTQLINEISQRLPTLVKESEFTYVEPFVGSGAVLFWMINNFPKLQKAVINDVNADLINVYETIRDAPKPLIDVLEQFQAEFHERENDEEEKKKYYYEKRDVYNARQGNNETKAALFIFLNRTCFNGLYRVNRNNLFNVPIGSYKRPMICDKQNILAVSEVLQDVEILNEDFEKTYEFADKNSFYYLDPPYKPLNATSSFNSYAENSFDDKEQIRLQIFCANLHAREAKWLLSNSDVQRDNFFQRIYKDFNIKPVKAKRAINSKAEKRGELNELLISNYKSNELNLAVDKQQKLWNELTQLKE